MQNKQLDGTALHVDTCNMKQNGHCEILRTATFRSGYSISSGQQGRDRILSRHHYKAPNATPVCDSQAPERGVRVEWSSSAVHVCSSTGKGGVIRTASCLEDNSHINVHHV